MPPSMSVIVPVYNEEEEITTIVPEVSRVLTERGGEWELLVVDNASTDDTRVRLQPFLSDPRIRLLVNEENRGKGYSVRRGMLEAHGERRLICDADCTPSLPSLPDMEAKMEDADIVAGARNARGSNVIRAQPLRRRAVSLGFIFLCRMIMGEPLRDVFCGFKLFGGKAAVDVFSRATINGWAFDAEALALARRMGYRVVPCGITWIHRPGSRLNIRQVIIPVLRELWAIRRRLKVETPGRQAVEALPDGGAGS